MLCKEICFVKKFVLQWNLFFNEICYLLFYDQMLWRNLKKNSKKSNCSRIRLKMNDKDLRRRMIGNSRALLARQLFENSALTRHLFENSALNSFAHLLQNANPILNSLLANVICQSVLRKVDKGTQTLLRIPTKPTFYIRYPWSTINRWIWLFIITFFAILVLLER